MKTFYVEVDTNDADYVGKIVKVEDELAEKFKPLIEKIKQFKPYETTGRSGLTWNHDCNFPCGECLREDLGEKTPMELYDITEAEFEEFRDAFRLWGDDYGLHTIVSIRDIQLGTVWL